jgi:dienelactone hydrolase
MRLLAFCLLALLLVAPPAFAESLPRAVYVDPPEDPHHPSRSETIHIPSGGAEIDGIAYIPSGEAPHPTALLLHGVADHEKNLDLAQSLRRAGWIVVSIDYRGSLEESDATLTYLRQPETVQKLGVDVRRIVVIGHSLGGWLAAQTLAHDPALLGAVLISPSERDAPADELVAQLKDRRLLLLYSHDGSETAMRALIDSLKAAKAKNLTAAYTATDHLWSDHRIALQAQVINWLQGLPAR